LAMETLNSTLATLDNLEELGIAHSRHDMHVTQVEKEDIIYYPVDFKSLSMYKYK